MSETWGYNYIKAASANFISLIEGANALNLYSDYWQRHARTNELISHLLGSEPCIFYIRRQEPGRNSESGEKWKLIVATDRDDFQLPLKLEERQQTLQLSGIVQRDGTGNLVLTAINLVDLEQGRVDSFSLPRLILLQRAYQNNIGIPETAFAEIATMPVCSSYVPTYDQIQGWEAYLGIQRRIAENRQFYVPVISYNYSASAKHITFTVDAALATSNGSISITLDEFWKRTEKAINEPLKFLASSAEIRNRRAGKELGKIESVTRNTNQIRLRLEPDIVKSLRQDNFALPETILLFFKDTGSLAQIQWQGQALRNLRLGHTHNFNLSKFFFEASQARPLEKTIQLAKEDLFLNNQARDWESKLYKLTAKVSSGITESAKNFLNKLQTETEQMLLLTSESQDNLEANLAPLSVLSTINSHIDFELESIREVTNKAFNEVTELSNQVREIEKQIEELELNLNNFRHWWLGIYQKIPNWLKPNVDDEELFNLNFLRNIPINFELWQQELEQSEAYLNQWEPTIQKWIEKLRQPSDLEYEALRKKYLDNANVIGVTCMKAARCNYLEKFRHFDVVIIDEVSKSIPPELLIPTLKGKKIVMIGDYRQLPPILDEENLDELAEELSIPRENLQFLEQSWFQLQFQAARASQTSITRRLNVQYRMHPQIMEAINQFYDEDDGGLSCGLSNPDIERAHNLAGSIIGEDNHIMWAAMPTGREFHERRDGTLYYNDVEIRKIKTLCKQMEQSWAPKVAQGWPKKEIGIITFYGAQLRRIENYFSADRFPSLDIRTGTVDRFQGMEKPIIIVSMVRNNQQSKFGFAQTPERVNVAFSRAKELLIIVGCHDLFTQLPIYQKVSQVVHKYKGFINVSNL